MAEQSARPLACCLARLEGERQNGDQMRIVRMGGLERWSEIFQLQLLKLFIASLSLIPIPPLLLSPFGWGSLPLRRRTTSSPLHLVRMRCSNAGFRTDGGMGEGELHGWLFCQRRPAIVGSGDGGGKEVGKRAGGSVAVAR